MADVRAIYSVGSSLVTWLSRAYDGFDWPGSPADKPSCSFQLAGSQELTSSPKLNPGVVFFLHRVLPNQHARRPASANVGRTSIALDLHYLVFPWADTAQNEALLLAWTMRALESHPVLGPGDLVDGGFSEGESVQVVLGELSNEDLMRIWDVIEPPYRLSVPYVARVVHVDLEPSPEGRPVVARDLVFEQKHLPSSKERP